MSRRLRKYLIERRKGLLWNGQIGFWRQAYMIFSVSGFISVQKLEFHATDTEWFGSLLAIVLTAFSVLFPLVMSIIYCKKDREEMEGRYDILIEPVNV